MIYMKIKHCLVQDPNSFLSFQKEKFVEMAKCATRIARLFLKYFYGRGNLSQM